MSTGTKVMRCPECGHRNISPRGTIMALGKGLRVRLQDHSQAAHIRAGHPAEFVKRGAVGLRCVNGHLIVLDASGTWKRQQEGDAA